MDDKMTNYIERYWRDANPEDAAKEPPMVSRFDNVKTSQDTDHLTGFRRLTDGSIVWYTRDGRVGVSCQVYDAPDPGEGWRLIDTANEKWQEGDEIYEQSTGTWRRRLTPFHDWALSTNRRRTVTYAPFTWEDRHLLYDRKVTVKWENGSEQDLCMDTFTRTKEGGFIANGIHIERLLSIGVFNDTGKPVGKEVVQ